MCNRFPTPVHTVMHMTVSPHLCTLSYIRPFPYTCKHCHTYSRFPTPVHTVLHTAVSPHLYTLCYIQQLPHTSTLSYKQHRTNCPTYSSFPTPVHTVLHTAVSPHLYTLSCIQQFPHTCTHCPTYSTVHTALHTAVSPHLYTVLLTAPYSLSYIQQFPYTCTHRPTYSSLPCTHCLTHKRSVTRHSSNGTPTWGISVMECVTPRRLLQLYVILTWNSTHPKDL